MVWLRRVSSHAQRVAAAVLGIALTVSAAPTAFAGSLLETVQKTHQVSFGWAEWKPFEYHDVLSGQLKGMLIDLAGAIGAQLNAKPTFVEDNWATLASGVAAHKFDLALLGITPERSQIVDFTHPLYYTSFTAIVGAHGTSATWSELNQPGYTVAVTTGSNTDEVLTNLEREHKIKARIIRIKDVGAAIVALASGKVTGYADQQDELMGICANQPQFKIVTGTFGAAEFGVAVAKGDPKFKAAVNNAVVEVLQNGTVQRLLTEYKVVGNQPALGSSN